VRSLPIANPINRFASTTIEYDGEEGVPPARLEVFEEKAKSILSEVDSPDVYMKWSVNPYRGCMHACVYCYARPSHQYLGFGAGTDFDRKIVVKVNAPELLRVAFNKKSWVGESITFSGNTDCYQPLEGKHLLTKRLLEVCLEYKNPNHVITKAALIRRDAELLGKLAREARCSATISIPFSDDEMARTIEPYASSPTARFETVRILADAGVEMSVNIAPVIPGINDTQIPAILERAKEAGATSVALMPVRLAAEVMPVFMERMAAAFPGRFSAMKSAIEQVRDGKLNESAFGKRMTGEGPRWDAIQSLFDAHVRKLGLTGCRREIPVNEPEPPTTFARPSRQGVLFQ
jgi:DNA repair photolyase